MQDLQHFKNDITLILSRERLDTYDSLEQYKENLIWATSAEKAQSL